MPFNIAFAVGDGTFESKFFSGGMTVSFGAMGDIVVLTPPLGQRVKLETLSAGSGVETGMSISVGGVNVIASLDLSADFSGDGQFVIGRSGLLASSGQFGTANGLTGGIDEELKIIKDAGSTTQSTNYSYHFGV